MKDYEKLLLLAGVFIPTATAHLNVQTATYPKDPELLALTDPMIAAHVKLWLKMKSRLA